MRKRVEMRKRVMTWTRNLACVLTLAMLPSMLMAVEVSEEKLVATAKRLSEAFHDLDYQGVQELLSDELLAKDADDEMSAEEEEAQWKERQGQGLKMMGAFKGLELAELDPPDGAFFTLRYERGSAEMFLVLDEEGKITEINVRPLEHPTEHPEEGEAKDAEHPEGDTEHPEKSAEHPEKDAEHPEKDAEHPEKDAEHPEKDAEHPEKDAEHPEKDAEHPEKDAEHPEKDAEHPEKDAEHPEKDAEHHKKDAEHHKKDAEHPEKDAEHPEKAPREPITTESVAQYLEAYAADEAEKQGGWLKIHDDKVGRDLELRLDLVHRERLAKTDKGTYFVCANFKTAEGKVYDLDFWVKETEEGLEVAETTLHKEEGEPRYNWVERDGVWKRISLK